MCFSQSMKTRIHFETSFIWKAKTPNYKSLDNYFQVDGISMGLDGHHRVKYFEALDLIMASICFRFDQPSFITSSLI